MPSYRFIDRQRDFEQVVQALEGVERYAIDTEFHRERSYYPRLALVQMQWDDELVLLDAVELDVEPLSRIFDTDKLAVLHAADQDLEVLEHACGVPPKRIFDTQIAAGFLGMSSASLAALHDRFLGERLPKGDRLTDWVARPLTEAQRNYAASDVARLLDLHDRLTADLVAAGRLEWAVAECEELLAKPRGPQDAEDAWRRIKAARQLRGRKLAIARTLAQWRESKAASVNQPPRYILADLAVVAIAQACPETQEELAGVRGVDAKLARSKTGAAILSVVREGSGTQPPSTRPPDGPPMDRHLRPAVTLVSAWVSQLSRDMDIETSLVATRSDIEALLRGDSDARLARGWRSDLVGEAIKNLVSGQAALAFDGEGRLVLEPRSA